MFAMTKDVAMSFEPMDRKRVSSEKVARATRDVETAIGMLARALLENAQVRASEGAHTLARGVTSAKVGLEGLVARVPAVGPLVAMELFRATHATTNEEELPTRPTNREESPSEGAYSALAYLEVIGCHVA